MMLESTTLFTRWQYVNPVVTRPAQGNAIVYIVPIVGKVTPRLWVMNYCTSSSKRLFTLLASKLISSKTHITPLNIKNIVTPLNLITSILFSIVTLSYTLLLIGAFIAAIPRTESTLFSIILIAPKWFSTFFAILVMSCLFHAIIITRNQYEIK